MKYVLIFLALSFSQSLFAEQGDVTQILRSDCGMSENKVIAADGTICEQDIAFGMLYEMFPSLFNELLPMWQLDVVEKTDGDLVRSTYIGLYNGDKVFFTLFDMFFKLVVFCITIYAVTILASTGVRLLKGEDIGDDQGGTKDNPKSWLAGIVLGGSFLIPIKNFFLGQAVVFTLGVTALSGANFVMSVFLGGSQAFFSETSNPTRATNDSPEGAIDRHYYIADSYYRYLTRMQLCRIQSAKWVLANDGINANSPEDYRRMFKCSSGETSVRNRAYKKGSNDDFSGFPWAQSSQYKYEPNVAISLIFGQGVTVQNPSVMIYNKEFSGIDFQTRRFEGNKCQTEKLENSVISFPCGSMEMQTVNWSDNDLFNLLDKVEAISFFKEIDSLNSSYSSGMDQASVQELVYTKWNVARGILEKGLVDAWNKEGEVDEFMVLDGQILNNSVGLKKILLDKNNAVFVDAAQKFHTHAMNAITFGGQRDLAVRDLLEESYTEESSTGSTDAFTYHFSKSEGFANRIESAQCMDYSWDHEGAKVISRFLKNESSSIDGIANPRCLDILTARIIEDNPEWRSLDAKDLMVVSRLRFSEIRNELVDEWVKSVQNFANQRRGVERSFNKVIRDDLPLAAWGRMRTQGYLAIADYAQAMNNIVIQYKRDIKLINNNFSLGGLGFNSSFISLAILPENTEQLEKFPEFKPGNEAFLATEKGDGGLDQFVDSFHWVAAQDAISRSPNAVTDNVDLADIFKLIESPTTFWNRLGLDMSREGRSIEKCMVDPAMCPFPQTDPVVELSLLGHDMLDVVAKVYTVALASAGLNAYTKSLANKNTGLTGAIKNGALGGVENSGSVITPIKQSMSAFFGLLNIIYKILGFILILFFTLGAILAYLLPFLPKLYLYMGFISWVMVLVMASFSVLLWSVYWIRFKEKRDVIKRAGYHFGVELMFKPTFNLIAVLFAWLFFYVIAFVIGMTIQWIWTLPLSGDSSLLRAYTDIVFAVIIVGLVYYVGLKYAYQLMDDLSGEMLEKLGVKNKKAKDGVSELIKAILYDKAKSGLEHAQGKLKISGGAREGMQEKLNESENTIASFQRAQQSLAKQNSAQDKSKDGGK